jgi:hypothetical protein
MYCAVLWRVLQILVSEHYHCKAFKLVPSTRIERVTLPLGGNLSTLWIKEYIAIVA